jgi:hypothetical protein
MMNWVYVYAIQLSCAGIIMSLKLLRLTDNTANTKITNIVKATEKVEKWSEIGR